MVVLPKTQFSITQDLRELNKYVIPEKQPISTFEEITDEMTGARHFSQLDVAKAFQQIEVTESSGI